MTEPEDLDEDLFADLYEGDESNAKSTSHAAKSAPTNQAAGQSGTNVVQSIETANSEGGHLNQPEPEATPSAYEQPQPIQSSFGEQYVHGNQYNNNHHQQQDAQGPGIKEDGKMFIGGLNWETTDQSLRDYFSQFGEVSDCNVMRDGATGRSRGFGFLTFRDPKCVNTVMVKEHYLDGKIIDPKRAIPRDEQEKTSKIFVGGVSQEANEHDFKDFFMQFGRVIDATLMMDKDTGRPRGFGFVTFDSEGAVENTLSRPLAILGKPIEVKKAQPRGAMRETDDKSRRFGGHQQSYDNPQDGGNPMANQGQQGGQGGMYGMTPQMMAQYWQRMQQYFAMMQQQMAASQAQGQMGMGMGNMNPAMMQQAMQQMQRGQPGSPGPQNFQGGMNPMMQQMMSSMQQGQQGGQGGQQPQQPQQHPQQQSQQQSAYSGSLSPNSAQGGGGGGGGASSQGRPGYNPQEQMMFEQQKFEQQQVRRNQSQGPYQGGQQAYDGYEESNASSQPGNGGGNQRSGTPSGPRGTPQGRGSQGPTQPPTAPANAPTGPKNAGKPTTNYRGGGRGGSRGYHPYSRS